MSTSSTPLPSEPTDRDRAAEASNRAAYALAMAHADDVAHLLRCGLPVDLAPFELSDARKILKR